MEPFIEVFFFSFFFFWKDDKIREYLKKGTGKNSFPTLELEEGKFMMESDDIVALVAKEKNVKVTQLNVSVGEFSK